MRSDTGQCHAIDHLRASRNLAPSVMKEKRFMATERSLWDFMIETYLYIFSLSTFSFPDLLDADLLDDFDMAFANLSRQSILSGFLLGTAQELYALIPRAVMLCRRAYKSMEASGSMPAELLLEIQFLVIKVIDWDCSSNDPLLASCAEIYRHAVLALLLSEQQPIDNDIPTSFQDDPVGSLSLPLTYQLDLLVDRSITFLRSIDPSDGLAVTFCWPLAILGSCARHTYQRSVFRQYLQDLSVTRQYGNLQRTISLLEAFWESGDHTRFTPGGLLMFMDASGFHFSLA